MSLKNLGKTKEILDIFRNKELLDNLKLEGIEEGFNHLLSGMSTEDFAKNLQKMGLGIDDIINLLFDAEVGSEDVKIIMESLGQSGAKSFKNIGNAIQGFLLTPLGKVVAVATAAALVIGAIDLFTTSPAEATEKMNESFSEFQDAQQKVSDLNSELETAKNRINELEAKGGLTFVEQTELEKLRESVRLLQIQADLAEKEAIREGKESVRDTVTAYEKNFKHDISAQDTQSYYNMYLDENRSVFLPPEIEPGTCTLVLYGSNEAVIAITNHITLFIDENILISDANSTEIIEILILMKCISQSKLFDFFNRIL